MTEKCNYGAQLCEKNWCLSVCVGRSHLELIEEALGLNPNVIVCCLHYRTVVSQHAPELSEEQRSPPNWLSHGYGCLKDRVFRALGVVYLVEGQHYGLLELVEGSHSE